MTLDEMNISLSTLISPFRDRKIFITKILQSFAHDISNEETCLQDYSNSEANASQLLQHLEEIFPR